MIVISKKIARCSLRAIRGLFSLAARNAIGTITHVTTHEPVAALTFDDGPDPEYTPRLLHILEKYHAHATFFMVGEAAQAHPELVRQIAHAGHAIGNHSWNHPSFPLISGRERRAQIRACAQAIAPYGERLFRPPYAEQNIASRIDALLLGHRVVMFDAWADDWCGGDPETVSRQLEQRIHPGGVIVLHDRLSDVLDHSYFDRSSMLKATEVFLHRVSGRFDFVTIPELLRYGRVHRELWYKKSNLELLNRLFVHSGPGRRYVQRQTSDWLDTLRNILLQTHPRRG